MAVGDKIKIFSEIMESDTGSDAKLNKLWLLTFSEDFFIRHLSFYVIKLLKEQKTVPLIMCRLKDSRIAEEDKLQLTDILAGLKPNTTIIASQLLMDRNPYVVRGILTSMALNKGNLVLRKFLAFIVSDRGRLIKRELVSELFGFMIQGDKKLQLIFEKELYDNQLVRGYFRDMEIKPPKHGRLSVFPANDYWALKTKANGIEYMEFKLAMEHFKKKFKTL